jgi:phage FluMu protein Com
LGMSIRIVCAKCEARLNAPETSASKKIKCPKCGTPIEVPQPDGDEFEVVQAPAEKPSRQPRRGVNEDHKEVQPEKAGTKRPTPAPNRTPLFLVLGLIAASVLGTGIYFLTRAKKPQITQAEIEAINKKLGIEMPPFHDYSKGVPPGMKPSMNPTLSAEERARLLNEEMEAEKQTRNQEEAAKYQVNIITVRKLGKELEIEYEFTKGYEDMPPPISIGFSVTMNGKRSVFDALATEIKKTGKLRLTNLAGGSFDGRVEVQIVILDVLRQPKATISNVALAN